MKPNEMLFETIGNLDDDLLDTLEERPRHTLRWTALAACALLVLMLFSLSGEDAQLQTLREHSTHGVQVAILSRDHFMVLVPGGENLAFTDYTVQVQNSYYGGLVRGDTITIRAARDAAALRQGDVLLAFLNQVEQTDIFVLAEGEGAAFAVSGQQAIALDSGTAVRVDVVIAALSGN